LAASYFKNITLLAAFLGLGLGFAAAKRIRLNLLTAPVALAVQVLVLALLDARGFDSFLRHPGIEWPWGIAVARDAVDMGVFYGFFAALFVSTILIFLPLGQLTGRLMLGFPPIRAYTINILGSLLGVIAFGLVSFFWLSPLAWFGIAGIVTLYVLRHERFGATCGGICILITMLATGISVKSGRLDVYSPYQRLEVERETVTSLSGAKLDTGVLIVANKAYHLRTANLSEEFVTAHGEQYPCVASMAAAYNLPYRLAPPVERVLVVGAGAGNDVAAALRNGATHVDAVEIDPAIVRMGQRYHAERPYADPRVQVHVDDARAFMRKAPSDEYDLIVFGLLDSHTLLSGMAAVRLDNFMYTQESMNEARRLLKPDGMLTLSFATGPGGYLFTRLFEMLQTAFSATPRCFDLKYDAAHLLAVGPSVSGDAVLPDGVNEVAYTLEPDVPPATDDWPFPYLPGRGWRAVPGPYFVMLGMLALITTVWVLAGSGRKTGISPHFMFLGGAFLLVETKGITELALIYGTTWIVSSVVIAAILALILLANLFVTIAPNQNRKIHYALLGAALVGGYCVPLNSLLSLDWWLAAVIATALLVVPLFFAGVIFATSLKQAASLPRVFSSNLLGAILGGLCEYASMAVGFRNLYLFGLGLYALSFVTMPRSRAVADDRMLDENSIAVPDGLPATAGDLS
ncbi:MAG: methyltransferase domain-containing protein, partial [Planctomycetes bacterium]|nr:methyltransferase domain-containing protein [Planctomycetota bacterium]